MIRLQGPCNPDEVSKLHFHDVDFQMVYVLKGWVKTYMEGEGETLMREGSAWTQPPRIRHMILDYSDDVELLEVILPAEFKTVELKRFNLRPSCPGAAHSAEPGIHPAATWWQQMDSGSRCARPGMTTMVVTSSPPRSRPSNTSSACPRRSTSARAR